MSQRSNLDENNPNGVGQHSGVLPNSSTNNPSGSSFMGGNNISASTTFGNPPLSISPMSNGNFGTMRPSISLTQLIHPALFTKQVAEDILIYTKQQNGAYRPGEGNMVIEGLLARMGGSSPANPTSPPPHLNSFGSGGFATSSIPGGVWAPPPMGVAPPFGNHHTYQDAGISPMNAGSLSSASLSSAGGSGTFTGSAFSNAYMPPPSGAPLFGGTNPPGSNYGAGAFGFQPGGSNSSLGRSGLGSGNIGSGNLGNVGGFGSYNSDR